MVAFLQAGSFIFGLIIGSFLNAVVYRMRKSQSLSGFSACPYCKHRLRAVDLVPIFSFLFLGGRCRYCHRSISRQYPLVELACGLAFLLITMSAPVETGAMNFQLVFLLFFQFGFASFLVLIFTYDYLYYLIPDLFIFGGALSALLYRLLYPGVSLSDGLGGILLVSGFFAILYLISSGRWIGLGDVKLGIFLGMLLGLRLSGVMLALSYFSGAIIGVFLILLQRKTVKGVLPFGTFLSASSLVTLLWGESIFWWYLHFFS